MRPFLSSSSNNNNNNNKTQKNKTKQKTPKNKTKQNKILAIDHITHIGLSRGWTQCCNRHLPKRSATATWTGEQQRGLFRMYLGFVPSLTQAPSPAEDRVLCRVPITQRWTRQTPSLKELLFPGLSPRTHQWEDSEGGARRRP